MRLLYGFRISGSGFRDAGFGVGGFIGLRFWGRVRGSGFELQDVYPKSETHNPKTPISLN